MAKKVLTDLNLNQNELQNVVVQNLATAPLNPKAGQQYFNTATKKLMVFNGTAWVDATNQGAIYTEGNGIHINENNVVSADTTVLATKVDLEDKQDVIEDLDDIRENAEAGATKSAANEQAITEINNSAVMQSGITSTKVNNYDTHVANTNIHVTAEQKATWSGKQDAIEDLEDIRDNAEAGATQSATNKTAIETINDSEVMKSGINSTKVTAYEGHLSNTTIHVTANDKATWSGKQDAIEDLDDIRDNAEAGKGAADTIANYGDIVSYDAEDFYRSNNPSGFQTANDVSGLIGTHNSSTEAHADIREALAGKVESNEEITGATKCKITYDAKGLVTGGADLVASDIPDLSATYIAVSTKGQANGVAELDANGLVPASQLPSYVDDVIDAYIVGEALSAGWLSLTAGGSALTPESGKIYVVLTAGQYANKTYRWSGSTYVEISSAPAQATESLAGIAEIATQAEVEAGTDDERIVTPSKLAGALSSEASATRELSNKSIDADDNTISNLELDNFKAGVVKTSVGAVDSAVDTSVVSEKAVATALELKTDKLTAVNPALTPVGGVCTWTISNTLGADAIVMVKEVATNEEVFCEVFVGDNVVIKMNASGEVAQGTYKAVIIG